ncbi:MAG TPA: mechanosensitive ion channel domain-containing protein [Rhizomicrobium sp.]|nr:mechanosensitive ion channel domain-containing protein [Rhizomicrobium sp.]
MSLLQHVTAKGPPPLSLDAVEAWLVDGAINIVAAILILAVGWWLSRKLSAWTRRALDRVYHFDETLKPLFASLVRYAVLIAALIAVLERFGIETTSLITLLGAAGLAIGLALQGALSNVASGVMLLVLRPFKVGDWITVQGLSQSGSVREVGLFTTILISADQSYVSLPNSAVFSSAIINASREPLSRVNFTVTVDVETDIEAALKIINDTLAEDARILKVPPPASGVAALKDCAVDLLVRCWVHNPDTESVSLDLHRVINDRFRRADIKPPSQRHMAANPPPALSANEDAPQRAAIRKSG